MEDLAASSPYAFNIVFEAKIRAMIVMLRKHRKLSDEEIKETIASAVEVCLKKERVRVE